jgi:hypothetical protein
MGPNQVEDASAEFSSGVQILSLPRPPSIRTLGLCPLHGEAPDEHLAAHVHVGALPRTVGPCFPEPGSASARAHRAIGPPSRVVAPGRPPKAREHADGTAVACLSSSRLVLLCLQVARGIAPMRPASWCQARCRSPPNWHRTPQPHVRDRSASKQELGAMCGSRQARPAADHWATDPSCPSRPSGFYAWSTGIDHCSALSIWRQSNLTTCEPKVPLFHVRAIENVMPARN